MRFIRQLYEELRFNTRVLISSGHRFYWDNSFSKAAALAYSSLFALVPITVLAFALLSSFASSSEHVPQVREFVIRQFVPDLGVVNDLLTYISQFSQSLASLNLLAIVFIVVTSVLLINSIEFALNEVWQVYEARSISQRIGIYCAVLVLAPVLALSSYYFARLRIGDYFATVGDQGSLLLTFTAALPFVFDFCAFVALYYLVPKAPVRWRSAVTGAVLSAALFGFAKLGFAYYVEGFSSYDKIYGALAAVPIFLLWLYVAWLIVLFGCEVAFQAQMLPRDGALRRRQVMSQGDGKFTVAVQVLLTIVASFRNGSRAPDELELAQRLEVSTLLLRPILAGFERAGILVHGDSRSAPLALLKSPDLITMADIAAAVGENSGAFAAELARAWGAIGARDAANVTVASIAAHSAAPTKGV